MLSNITANLKEQIKNLEAELSTAKSERRKLEIKKTIEENKTLLETTYKELSKRNGKTFSQFKADVLATPEKPIRCTGIDLVDSFFDGGFEEAQLINLIGESGAGKTTLALEILVNVSRYQKAVLFNFEMGDKRTLKRLERLNLTDNHDKNLIIDSDSRDIEIIKREVTLYANDGVHFFVIDSNMKIEANIPEDYKRLRYISNELSKLTQQTGAIIILINQMSEEALKSSRATIKGNNDQVYDSDIILLYKFHPKDENKRILQVTKNRQNDKKESIETSLQDGRTISNTYTSYTSTFITNNDFLRDIV